MATNIVSIKNSKKHYTNDEKAARIAAENALKRGAVKMKVPSRVKAMPEALRYWKNTLKKFSGIELFDDLDTDMLASYCIQAAIRDKLYADYERAPFDDTMKLIQGQERLILQYASKLGLTAESRARLAKKTAEAPLKNNKFSRFSGTG